MNPSPSEPFCWGAGGSSRRRGDGRARRGPDVRCVGRAGTRAEHHRRPPLCPLRCRSAPSALCAARRVVGCGLAVCHRSPPANAAEDAVPCDSDGACRLLGPRPGCGVECERDGVRGSVASRRDGAARSGLLSVGGRRTGHRHPSGKAALPVVRRRRHCRRHRGRLGYRPARCLARGGEPLAGLGGHAGCCHCAGPAPPRRILRSGGCDAAPTMAALEFHPTGMARPMGIDHVAMARGGGVALLGAPLLPLPPLLPGRLGAVPRRRRSGGIPGDVYRGGYGVALLVSVLVARRLFADGAPPL